MTFKVTMKEKQGIAERIVNKRGDSLLTQE